MVQGFNARSLRGNLAHGRNNAAIVTKSIARMRPLKGLLSFRIDFGLNFC
jgi:hypothetical protein